MASEDEEDFWAKGCVVAVNDETRDVRVTFEGTDEDCAVHIPKAVLPRVVAALQSKIEDERITPIDRGSMRPGGQWSVEGFGVRLAPNGDATLTLDVRVDDNRGVTIPIRLSPDERRQLRGMLEDRE